MITPRCEFGAVALDGRIYTIGGTVGSSVGSVEVYDPTTNVWTARSPLPTPRQSLVVAAAGGLIYAIGGFQRLDSGRISYSRALEVYDPRTDAWSSVLSEAPLPATTADIPGDQVIAGGSIDDLVYVAVLGEASTLLRFDPSMDTWTTLPNGAPSVRDGMVGTTLGSRLYLLETKDLLLAPGARFGAFDPLTGYWYAYASMPILRDILLVDQGLAGANDTLYALGGTAIDTISTAELLSGKVFRFRRETNAWLADSCLPRPRHSMGTAAVGDTIYAIGGSVVPHACSPTGEVYAARHDPTAVAGGECSYGSEGATAAGGSDD